MTLSAIWEWILRLFGKRPLDKRAEKKNADYAKAYEDTTKVSFGAIVANSIANKAVSDSTFTITDAAGRESRRTEWIKDGIQQLWGKKKKIVAQTLGKGGKILMPYVAGGRACVDVIDQSRMCVADMWGGKITSASLLAEVTKVNGRVYLRWQDYTLENGVHTILCRVTNENGNEVPFDTVPAWADVTPEINIAGVDRILFGFLKSPVDNREDADIYGVPITYGSENLIEQINTCLEEMAREYELKRAFVGADDRLFGKDKGLPRGGLFKLVHTAGGTEDKQFWQVFDPAIRDSAYANRFWLLCELLEKSIGTSKGVLTEPVTANATATEIKQANYNTFTLIDDVRESIELAFDDVAYALDVLAEHFGATPAGTRGDYQLAYDWDSSLLESSSETFAQLSELESRSLIRPERLNAWVTGQGEDDARKEIEEARAARDAAAIEALSGDDG